MVTRWWSRWGPAMAAVLLLPAVAFSQAQPAASHNTWPRAYDRSAIDHHFFANGVEFQRGDTKIAKPGDTVTCKFTIAPNTQRQQLSLISYSSPDQVWTDLAEQKLYKSDTGIFGPGPGSLSVQLPVGGPGSGYQVDFVFGPPTDANGKNPGNFIDANNAPDYLQTAATAPGNSASGKTSATPATAGQQSTKAPVPQTTTSGPNPNTVISKQAATAATPTAHATSHGLTPTPVRNVTMTSSGTITSNPTPKAVDPTSGSAPASVATPTVTPGARTPTTAGTLATVTPGARTTPAGTLATVTPGARTTPAGTLATVTPGARTTPAGTLATVTPGIGQLQRVLLQR